MLLVEYTGDNAVFPADIDAIDIVTPNDSHAEIAIAAVLEREVSARNASLSEIRQRAAGEGALYRIAKSELVLNAQTTAQSMQQAQTSLERFSMAKV